MALDCLYFGFYYNIIDKIIQIQTEMSLIDGYIAGLSSSSLFLLIIFILPYSSQQQSDRVHLKHSTIL